MIVFLELVEPVILDINVFWVCGLWLQWALYSSISLITNFYRSNDLNGVYKQRCITQTSMFLLLLNKLIKLFGCLLEQFAANHCSASKSDVIFEMGDELQWRLLTFLAPYSNTYSKTWKISRI